MGHSGGDGSEEWRERLAPQTLKPRSERSKQSSKREEGDDGAADRMKPLEFGYIPSHPSLSTLSLSLPFPLHALVCVCFADISGVRFTSRVSVSACVSVSMSSHLRRQQHCCL